MDIEEMSIKELEEHIKQRHAESEKKALEVFMAMQGKTMMEVEDLDKLLAKADEFIKEQKKQELKLERSRKIAALDEQIKKENIDFADEKEIFEMGSTESATDRAYKELSKSIQEQCYEQRSNDFYNEKILSATLSNYK